MDPIEREEIEQREHAREEIKAIARVIPPERRAGIVEKLRRLNEAERRGRERAALEHMRALGLIP